MLLFSQGFRLTYYYSRICTRSIMVMLPCDDPAATKDQRAAAFMLARLLSRFSTLFSHAAPAPLSSSEPPQGSREIQRASPLPQALKTGIQRNLSMTSISFPHIFLNQLCRRFVSRWYHPPPPPPAHGSPVLSFYPLFPCQTNQNTS